MWGHFWVCWNRSWWMMEKAVLTWKSVLGPRHWWWGVCGFFLGGETQSTALDEVLFPLRGCLDWHEHMWYERGVFVKKDKQSLTSYRVPCFFQPVITIHSFSLVIVGEIQFHLDCCYNPELLLGSSQMTKWNVFEKILWKKWDKKSCQLWVLVRG